VSPERPVFCFDFASPLCWFAAERASAAFAGELEWLPVSLEAFPHSERFDVFRCATEELAFREDVQRRALELGLQPLRWPQRFPFDSSLALRAATYAKGIGRSAAFALAAFRQAFAGGHPLESEDFVLIAAAACEMHPKAVLSALASDSIEERLRAAGAEAASRGVNDLPAFIVGERVLVGERMLERAAGLAAAELVRVELSTAEPARAEPSTAELARAEPSK
jgi:2-hydroxychromene-2-carboxylate isomerase